MATDATLTSNRQSCPNCGSHDVTEALKPETFEYGWPGSVPLSVTQPVMTCTACKESWTDYRGEEAREAVVARYRRAFAPKRNTVETPAGHETKFCPACRQTFLDGLQAMAGSPVETSGVCCKAGAESGGEWHEVDCGRLPVKATARTGGDHDHVWISKCGICELPEKVSGGTVCRDIEGKLLTCFECGLQEPGKHQPWCSALNGSGE